jgi:hypothetical protein
MAKPSKKHIQLLSPENYIRQKARNLPVYKCLVNSNWKDSGIAQILISRKHTNGNLTTGMYMIDLYCLGARDTFYHFNRPEFEFNELVENMSEGLDMIPIDYALVHNIIHTALEFSEELGFKPHKDFTSVTQYILEEDTDDIELMEIECGLNGKPAFFISDSFSEVQSRKIIHQLEQAVGSGNFDIIDEYVDDMEMEDMAKVEAFDQMKPQERKDLFLQLSQKEILDLTEEEFQDLHWVTESIYVYDVTDDDVVDAFFDKWKNEMEMEIDENEFSNESLGVDSVKFSEEELDDFTQDFGNLLENTSKTLNDFEDLSRKWGNLPFICYHELIWLIERDPVAHDQKLEKYLAQFPAYTLLRLEKLKTDIINQKDDVTFEGFGFEQLFKGRSSITEFEMLEYQLTKTLFMLPNHKDLLNELAAQSMIIDDLDLSQEYLTTLESMMSMIKVRTLREHFNGIPQEKTRLSISKAKKQISYQFKIQLKDVSNPTVWRRILMPADATFEDFHDAIQIAFGWENAHLFMFSPKGYQSSPIIELENDEDDNPFARVERLSAETLTLADIFTQEKQTYTYIYDFGDDWMHKITLEKISSEDRLIQPLILKGQGACPPEDCGGAWGYEHLKHVLANKIKPDYLDLKEWLGLGQRESWDSEKFDLIQHQDLMNDYFDI